MAVADNVIGIRLSGDAKQLQQALQQGSGYVEGFAKDARGHLGGLSGDMDKAGASAGGLSNSLKGAFVGGGVVAGLYAVKSMLGDVTRELIQTQIQADKARNGLNFAVGAGNVAREMEFITQSAQTLGLELVSTGTQYTKLAAAARGTSLEGKTTRDIFTSIAQASTVMGLSAEETSGALLAITQIISKGKVQSEELRGQLGERLPGAFQVAARAMGVTTGELDKMLETGQVLASDFLPKFANQLSMEVAPQVDAASQSMQASMNRLSNAWTDLKRNINEGGASKIIQEKTDDLGHYVQTVSDAMQRAREDGSGTLMQVNAGLREMVLRLPFDVLSTTLNNITGQLNWVSMGALKLNTNLSLLPTALDTNANRAAALAAELPNAQAKIALLSAQLAKVPDNIYLKSEVYQLSLFIEKAKQAKFAQDRLRGVSDSAGEDARFSRSASAYVAEQEAVKKSIADITAIKQKLSGVDTDYLPTLNKLQTARERGVVTEQEYVRLVGDLATKNYTKPHAEKQASAYDTLSTAIAKNLAMAQQELLTGEKLSTADKMRQDDISRITEAYRKKEITTKQWLDLSAQANAAADTRALADSTTETNRYVAAINDKIAAVQLDIETTGNLSEGQKLAAKFTQDLASGTLKLSEADAIARTAVLERLIAIEQTNAAQKEQQKQYDKESKQLQESTDATNKKAMAIEDEVALYGKSEEAIKDLTIARLRDEQAKQMSYGDEVRVAEIEAEIAAIKRLAKANDALNAKKDSSNAAKKMTEDMARASDEINRTLTDSLMRAFESGEGFGKTFAKTVEAMFKTMVLRPVISAVMQPVSNIVNDVLASIGIPGTGSSGSTGAAGGGSANGFMNFVKGLFGTNAGNGGNLGAAAGGSADKAALFGNAGYGETGGSMGSSAMAAIPVIGWIMAGMSASGNAYDAGARPNNKYTVYDPAPNVNDRTLQALGMSGKTAAMFSGSALQSQFLDSIFGSKYQDKGAALTSTVSSKGTSSVGLRVDTHQSGGFLGGGETDNSAWSVANPEVTSYIDTMAKQATASAKSYAKALGLSAEAVDGFTKDITVDISGMDAEKQKAAIDKALASFFDDMVSSAYGAAIGSVAKAGETSGQTMQRLAVDLTAVNDGLRLLGLAMLPVGVNGATTAAALVDAFGGVEKLQSAVATYYDKFYTSGEKAANGVTSLNESFAALGVSTPATHAAFRQLIEGIDISTVSGQNMAASLLALAPSFDAVAAAAVNAAQVMASAISDYGTSEELRAFNVEQIRQGLADGGVNLSNDQIANATRADARQLYESYRAAGNTRAADAVLSQARAFASITAPRPSAQSVGGSGGGGGGGASAASEIASAWQAITDSIWGEVKRIRGLIEGTGDDAFAAAQARFAIATAQTRAGDQDAGKALPELSQNVLRLADLNAKTLLELKMVQAQTAGSLMDTRAILAAQYGLTLPSFDIGTNMVPQDMIALIHKGEAIVPAAYNPALGGAAVGGGDWWSAYALMAQAMDRMTVRLAAIETNTGGAADSSLSMSRILTRAMPDGNTLEMRVVT